MQDLNTFHVMEDEVLFIDNLRSAAELPSMRMSYNSIVYCKTGRIVVEMGGNQQVKVAPGQLLLIPTAKIVEPLLISTDAEVTALLISDRVLKSVLGNQINIWNKAMYPNHFYVLNLSDEHLSLFDTLLPTFSRADTILKHEILVSLLRAGFLLVCDLFLLYNYS